MQRALWFVGSTMWALILGIVGNWLTDPAREHLGGVGAFVTGEVFKYIALIALLGVWAFLYRQLSQTRRQEETPVPTTPTAGFMPLLKDPDAIPPGYTGFVEWEEKVPPDEREEQEITVHKSVAEAIRNQSENLVPHIVLTYHEWDHSEIKNQSYIDFEFHFVNASVFNIFLNGSPSGHIRWGDNILESIPELEHPRLDGHNVGPLVKAGSGLVIRLRQFLRDWAAQRIYMAQDGPFSFSFDDVRIYIGSNNDTTDQRPYLPLGTYTFSWRKSEPDTADSQTESA